MLFSSRSSELLAALVLLVAVPAVAEGQGGQSTASGESSDYRALIEEALQEFSHGNWEEAGALFARAHAVEPSARHLARNGPRRL